MSAELSGHLRGNYWWMVGLDSKIESSLVSTRPDSGAHQEFVRIILTDGTFAGLSEELERLWGDL